MLRGGFFPRRMLLASLGKKKNLPRTMDSRIIFFLADWPLSRDLNETAQGRRIFPDKFLFRYNWEKCTQKVCPQNNKKGTNFQGKKGGLNYCLFFRGREAYLLFIFDLGRLMGCFSSSLSPWRNWGQEFNVQKGKMRCVWGGEGVHTHAVGQQQGWLHRHETPTTTQKVWHSNRLPNSI